VVEPSFTRLETPAQNPVPGNRFCEQVETPLVAFVLRGDCGTHGCTLAVFNLDTLFTFIFCCEGLPEES
jgi:hypothetical protein